LPTPACGPSLSASRPSVQSTLPRPCPTSARRKSLFPATWSDALSGRTVLASRKSVVCLARVFPLQRHPRARVASVCSLSGAPPSATRRRSIFSMVSLRLSATVALRMPTSWLLSSPSTSTSSLTSS
ncbi:hypothetical protein GGH99_006064, partial [Coemansia sp. RSA 1285]